VRTQSDHLLTPVQLFGDTVNCAARMESNGLPGMIQVSQKTADLLIEAGKENWVRKRTHMVEAKGKGALQTYWVDPPSRTASESQSDMSNSDIDALQDSCGMYQTDFEMLERLIEWNLQSFTTLLKGVVAWRAATGGSSKQLKFDATAVSSMMEINPRAEISEVVTLPDNALDLMSSHGTAPAEVELGREVIWQLRDYISSIAYMYRYVIGSSHESRNAPIADRTLCSAARTRSTTSSTLRTWRPPP
jgi:Adenylate and Guanylate cyclase catalytic domain/Calicivirus putative RNA polymerase/capsid protein